MYISQGELFDAANRRPYNYKYLSFREQWEIDKMLGILDWDGSCPHSERKLCPKCKKEYNKMHKK